MIAPPLRNKGDLNLYIRELERFLNDLSGSIGIIKWVDLDFTSSNLTAIITRLHSDLQGRTTTSAHPATAIDNTPAGTIAATTVQAAINELDTEKQAVMGADDNYVTDAQLVVIGNTSGTNTGDASGHSALAPLASPTFTGTVTTPAIVVSSETASEIASFDASKNIKSLAVATYPSLTELSYVKGVSSAIQTQLGTKAPTTSPTFATSITGSYLTASEMLVSDASSKIVSAPVATYPSLTELSYVKGVSSAIQTQLGNKQASMGADDNYVTDAEKVVIGNTSGTNTGDNSVNTLYSGLVTNATHTGDATGSGALTVVKIQGKSFPTLGVGDDTKYPKYDNGTNAFVMTAIAGGGDTIAPAANSADYIPQWNGANSKTLKDGLAVPAGGLAGITALDLKAPLISPSFTTPALGTPSSGTLTNCTGLPQAGVVGFPSPKFSANKNASNQTGVVTATPTKVTFTTEVYDVGSGYDAANSKWVPGVVGKAHIDGAAFFTNGAANTQLSIFIYLNGASYREVITFNAVSDNHSVAISADIPIDAITDYIELYVTQNTGSNQTISGNITRSWFSGHMLV